MPSLLNEKELASILAEVEGDLNKSLELAKAGEPPPESSASPEASASAGGEGSPSAGGEPSAPPAGPPDASASPSAPADPSAAPPADPSAAPAGDPAAGGDLASKLNALPDDQLMQLYQTAKQIVFSRMQAQSQGPGAAGPSTPPAGPPAGAPPGPSASPAGPPPGPSASPAGGPPMPPAFKAEGMPKNPANGGGSKTAIKLGKSEDDMDAKKLTDLQAQIEGLTKAVTILAGAPLRKAVTSIAHVPKPGDAPAGQKDVTSLSKTEITAKLTEKTKDPSLSKKDRQLVNGFYDGRFDVTKIAHLLQ